MFRYSQKKENLKGGTGLNVGDLTDFWKYIQLHKAYPVDDKLLKVHYVDKLYLLSSFECSNKMQFCFKFGSGYEKMPERK